MSPDPADVFGWTRPRPGDTFRLLVLLGQRRDRFQRDPMCPVVAEVVQVGQLIPGVRSS